jgi:hypothetical protein
MKITVDQFENCAWQVIAMFNDIFDEDTTIEEFLIVLNDYNHSKWYYLHTIGKTPIPSKKFYEEYNGHTIPHLTKILEAVNFFNIKHRVWLAGDSSLDNKHWLLKADKAILPPVYDAVLSSSFRYR